MRVSSIQTARLLTTPFSIPKITRSFLLEETVALKESCGKK